MTPLRLVLIVTALALAAAVVYRPKRLHAVGRQVRLVAFAYVAAILIGAALRLVFGWGT